MESSKENKLCGRRGWALLTISSDKSINPEEDVDEEDEDEARVEDIPHLHRPSALSSRKTAELHSGTHICDIY